MPISYKIRQKIDALNESQDFKDLLLEILTIEDKGNHKYKEAYDKLASKYLAVKDGDDNDQNNQG